MVHFLANSTTAVFEVAIVCCFEYETDFAPRRELSSPTTCELLPQTTATQTNELLRRTVACLHQDRVQTFTRYSLTKQVLEGSVFSGSSQTTELPARTQL